MELIAKRERKFKSSKAASTLSAAAIRSIKIKHKDGMSWA